MRNKYAPAQGHALLKKVAKLSAEDKFQQACVIFEEAAKQYTVLSQCTFTTN